jgi:putative nucleotidyltransferase with HDIG domain
VLCRIPSATGAPRPIRRGAGGTKHVLGVCGLVVRSLAIVIMVSEAREMARSVLAEVLPRRWEHVQGVAGAGEHVAASLALSREVLVSAAWLHDIGYAPNVVGTGFHPLDGARYLTGLGVAERIVNLVARHSNAILEADLRGIGDLVAVFPDEGGVLRDALWYCDLTTSPDGQPVSAPDRIAEIKARYGPGDIVTRFITDGALELLAAVERTERRLAG